MVYQVFIGLISEGTTDSRFLPEIIERVFIEASFSCHSNIVIEGVKNLEISKTGKSFVELMIEAVKVGFENGVSILCIHTDADDVNQKAALEYKFKPVYAELERIVDKEQFCDNIVPIIPVRMTEAWMLADKPLLMKEIKAGSLDQNQLKINRAPETISDPKKAIEEAIRIVSSERSKKRKGQLKIGDLYDSLGQKIDLAALRRLESFNHFESEVNLAFQRAGLLR